MLNTNNLLNTRKQALQSMVSDYYKGFNLAATLDAQGNRNLILDQNELALIDPSLMENESLMHGINKFSANVAGSLETEQIRKNIDLAGVEETIKQQEIDKNKLIMSYLPMQLQNELRKDGLDITQAGIKIQLSQKELEQYAIIDQMSKQQLKAIKLENDLNQLKIDNYKKLEGREDKEYNRTESLNKISDLESILQSNNDKKADVATAILSTIMVGQKPDGDAYETYTPFYSIITDDQLTSDKFEKYFDDLPSISAELKGLHAAFAIGKGEEQVADFDIVLQQLADVSIYKDVYDQFQKEFENQIKNMPEQSLTQIAAFDGTVMTIPTKSGIMDLLDTLTIPESRKENIRKAIEWNSTGIYDTPDLNLILNILDQDRIAKEMIENERLNSLLNTGSAIPSIQQY